MAKVVLSFGRLFINVHQQDQFMLLLHFLLFPLKDEATLKKKNLLS